MTNFERFRENLTEQGFVDIMFLNCDVCPIPYDCPSYTNAFDNVKCEEVLTTWCESEVTT